MTGLATRPEDILRFIRDRTDGGEATVLVTLTGIEGSSPRALGAQMAVTTSGEYVGSFSGGCIEGAVVAEALDALAARQSRQVRYGIGSPYFDIRLPCGGGIDLLFTPLPSRKIICSAIARLERREPAALSLSMSGMAGCDASTPIGRREGRFIVTYVPGLRVIALGQGEELTATAKLAAAFGAETLAFSPYERDIRSLRGGNIEASRLSLLTMRPDIVSDPWTAFIFLFHDRDWEEALIPWALGLPRLYIGALGSRRSHAARTEMLEAAGAPAAAIRALRSPVGLIPSTRDPSSLAVSIMAEMTEAYINDASLPLAAIAHLPHLLRA